jgi:hypothetical protein
MGEVQHSQFANPTLPSTSILPMLIPDVNTYISYPHATQWPGLFERAIMGAFGQSWLSLARGGKKLGTRSGIWLSVSPRDPMER